jgi:Flp pilus assembly protein TadG
MTAEHGQATVELTALLPLLVLLALGTHAVLAAHAAHEQAGTAAEAGAIALLQDREPRAAARDALPGGARERSAIAVDGRRVTVSVRPALPLLAARLTGRATADAGPEPPR